MNTLNIKESNFRRCRRCVSDTTMSEIEFDENNGCNFCKLHDRFVEMYPLGEKGKKRINDLVIQIKRDGKKKPYDCIVGLSGGTDSTFLLYWAVKNGLRPLAVSFDNAWSTDIAVKNIRNATNILGVDLHTVIADWEEMKDLQRSFLKASVSDADAPTDYAIYSVLYTEAIKAGVKYSLNGHSFRTEGSVPKSWSYFDGRYVKSVLSKYGTLNKIKSFPLMSLIEYVYYSIIKKIRDVRVFDYIDYDKSEAKNIIAQKLNWEDYGGHHHENIFTRFFQSYYLPVKFGIDKRKVEYSALIRSNQMTRTNALKEIDTEYPYKIKDVNFVIKKLGFSQKDWDLLMGAPRKTFNDFPTYYSIIKRLKFPMKVAAELNLIPKILYEKYTKM